MKTCQDVANELEPNQIWFEFNKVEFYKFNPNVLGVPNRLCELAQNPEALKDRYYKGADFYRSGIIKIMGWQANFKPILKEFWFETSNGLMKGYAPNKTLLRASYYGRIYRIVEIKKQ